MKGRIKNMHKIGVVTIESMHNLTVNVLLKSNGYCPVEIEKKESIEELDSLIILSEKKEDFSKVCDWIISAQEQFHTFVWVFSAQCSEKERAVYIQLGANGVVNHEEQISELIFLARNVLFKTSHLNLDSVLEETTSNVILKPENLSVIFNGDNEIQLTQLEFQLVNHLYKKVNNAVSYEELNKVLWSGAYDKENRYRVANLVFHIREKFGGGGENESLLRTVRSKGYMLCLSN